MSSGTDVAMATPTHAGQRPQPVEQRARAKATVAGVVTAASAAVVGGQQHALAIEPGVGVAGVGEGAEEQPGDDQHDHRERDLGGHRRRAPPAGRGVRAPAATSAETSSRNTWSAGEQRRRQDRADETEPERHGQASRVDRGLEADRQRRS